MVLRIVEAPLKEQFLTEDGSMDRIWLRYMADSAEALTGYWGNTQINSPYDTETTINILTLQGDLVNLYMKFEGLDTTSGDEFEIPSPYLVFDDILEMIEIDSGSIVSINNVLVEDSKFTLPALDTTNTVILKGNFRRNNNGI